MNSEFLSEKILNQKVPSRITAKRVHLLISIQSICLEAFFQEERVKRAEGGTCANCLVGSDDHWCLESQTWFCELWDNVCNNRIYKPFYKSILAIKPIITAYK